MEKLKKSVGARAKKARMRLGYKNREHFAELLGVHNNTVGFLERGETWISPELLLAYRDKAHIAPAELLIGEPVGPSGAQIAGALVAALKQPGFERALAAAIDAALAPKTTKDKEPQ